MIKTLVLFLSLSSSSCGAQDWYDGKAKEGTDIADQSQDQWINDRSVDFLNSYHSLLYNSLINSRTFKIDGDRCSEDTLCMSILESEKTRKALYDLLSKRYSNSETHSFTFGVCEDYRVNLDAINRSIETLISQLNDMQKRTGNPSMSDVLQFGTETKSIAEYYINNIVMLYILRTQLAATAYIFTYIYPSEKYTTYLSTIDNPLKQR